jgi:hypothetical protein
MRPTLRKKHSYRLLISHVQTVFVERSSYPSSESALLPLSILSFVCRYGKVRDHPGEAVELGLTGTSTLLPDG